MNIKKEITAFFKQGPKGSVFPAGITLLVGLSLSILAFTIARNWENMDIRSEFNRAAENRIAALKKAIESNLLVLESLGSFYGASREVDRHEFREFVAPIFSQNLSIQALEWIPRLSQSERLPYEKAAQSDGLPGFQITERGAQGNMRRAGQRAEYFPVYFVEPMRGNETALGFDLASNPTRRQALERSRNSREMIASGRITLVQAAGERYGFLVFRPVYQKSKPLRTIADRRRYLEGFVLGVFRIDDIVEEALANIAPVGIDILIYDRSAAAKEQFLYFHSSRTRKEPLDWRGAEKTVERSALRYRHDFNMAGRKWSIECAETPHFMATGRTWQPWSALLGVMLCTAIAVGYLIVNIRRSTRLSKAYQDLQTEITERRRSEEALQESEERFRHSFDNAPIGMALVDINERFVQVNHVLCSILGYTQDVLLSKTVTEITHPDDRSLEADHKMQIADGNAMGFRMIKRYIRSDGDIVWGQLSVSTVLDKHENPLYFIGQLEDITAQKLAAEEKEKLKNQLQHAQKMEAVGTLAGGIAHDFNNLLQAVLGYSQLLLLGRQEGGPGHKELSQIVRAAEKGAELVTQLLIFGRKAEAQMRPLDLNHEIEQLRKLLARTIPKMIEIELHLDGKLKIINADKIQIEQVLMNLAVNARDAMHDGGTLSITTGNAEVDTAYRKINPEARPGKYVLLAVSDTGVGMEPETLEHIFEPFYTTKETGKGTGLGLAIVYGIVKSHEGIITCRSRIGKGTTFEIYLPAIEETLEATLAEESFKPVQGSETILLVEDEVNIQELGKKILERFGYTVLIAGNGVEALNFYRREQQRIDLIILDLIMPEMDGVRCFRALRELNPDLKIIIASGYNPEPDTKDTLTTLADGFIIKPYRLDQMLAVVQGVLDHKPTGPS